MRSFFLALQFLTRLPISIAGPVEGEDLVRSTLFFPLVGGLLGLSLAGLDALASQLYARPVVVVLDLAFLFLVTGGLHWDGLLDSADALFSGRPPERALEIMKDSRVGAMGVLTALLLFALQATLLLTVDQPKKFGLLLLFPLAGRLSLVLVGAHFPPARTTGLGALLAGRIPFRLWGSAWLYSLLLTLMVARPAPGALSGVLALLASQTLGWLAAGWASWRLGGITGDIFGACAVLSELGFMLLWVAL